MSERVWIVYKITCRVDGKIYIGVTGRSLGARWKQHLKSARRNGPWLLQRAIRKHGTDSFDHAVLALCASMQEAHVCERAMIATHRAFYRTGYGYNMTVGGGGTEGWKDSPETVEKKRRQRTGRKHSEETIALMRAAWVRRRENGQVITPELRARWSAARRGKKRPDVSAWRKAWFGTPEGAEYLKGLVERGRVASESMRGKKLSPEHAAIVTANNRAKANDPEYLARLSAGVKRAHARKKLRNALTKASYSENRLFAEYGFTYPSMEG